MSVHPKVFISYATSLKEEVEIQNNDICKTVLNNEQEL
jgi:hypothetical protein